jgi:hypothetical protein
LILRHAAALALVGWYLMMPQPSAPQKTADTPLSEWKSIQMGMFVTASDCEKERAALRKVAVKASREIQHEIDALPESKLPLVLLDPKVAQDSVVVGNFATGIEASRCIATDDPRLKSK